MLDFAVLHCVFALSSVMSLSVCQSAVADLSLIHICEHDHMNVSAVQPVNDLFSVSSCLQCFDAVGWAAGRASDL